MITDLIEYEKDSKYLNLSTKKDTSSTFFNESLRRSFRIKLYNYFKKYF